MAETRQHTGGGDTHRNRAGQGDIGLLDSAAGKEIHVNHNRDMSIGHDTRG
jgi:hypothetical protein